MNATQRTILWKRKSIPPKYECHIPHGTRTLAPKQLLIPDDSERTVRQTGLVDATSCVARKARSGPGRRRVHRPTEAIPGPSPNANDLSGKPSPPRRTCVAEGWGETRPLSPQTPLYPLSVPMGRPTHLVAERWTTAGNNGAATCAKIGRDRGPTDSKQAKPDPRLRTQLTSVCRPNSQVLRAFSFTP